MSNNEQALLHHGRVVGRDVGGLRAHLAGRSCFSGGVYQWAGEGARSWPFGRVAGVSESVGELIVLPRGGGYVGAGNAYPAHVDEPPDDARPGRSVRRKGDTVRHAHAADAIGAAVRGSRSRIRRDARALGIGTRGREAAVDAVASRGA